MPTVSGFFQTSSPFCLRTGRIGAALPSWFTAITALFVKIRSTSASSPAPVFIAEARRSAERMSGPGKAAHMVNIDLCSLIPIVGLPGCAPPPPL